MEKQIKETIKRVSQASTDFENNNSDLKRRYLIRNIQSFNYIVSLIDVNQGSFGTGYPFYVLKKDLSGQIPIIKEQIRYNDELIQHAENTDKDIWICESCLKENYDHMYDLKHVCKPCPNMDDELKPRKLMNRLPDLDMWMVCKDGEIENAEEQLAEMLEAFNIHTSDVDPIQTIKDMEEISEDIKNGKMPNKFLPIDAHIVEYSEIKELIEQVPEILKSARITGLTPYLPIHPRSYRKEWQYDDEGYNFIYDFLSAFTEFDLEDSLNEALKKSRYNVAKEYNTDELYNFLIQSATAPNKRRNETPELKKKFEKRINGWIPKKEFWEINDGEER